MNHRMLVALINLVGGFCLGTALTFLIMMNDLDYHHDPKKMLELRSECLRQDNVSKYTTWCDDYAEQFSRIKK